MRSTSPQYKKLYAEWLIKLAASGFVDIERGDQRQYLHSYAGSIKLDSTRLEGQRAFYEYATLFLNDHCFSKGERDVWNLFSLGHTIRDIATTLNLRPTSTHKTISRLRSAMAKRYNLRITR